MDFFFTGVAIGVSIVVAAGISAALTTAIVLAYAKSYYSYKERRATDGAVCLEWRRSRVWSWIKALVRYDPPLRIVTITSGGAAGAALPPGPILYACQPHGMLALTAALAVFSGDLDRPGTPTLLVIHNWFWWVPGVRELMLALGCIDKQWSSIEKALKRGFAVAVLPGGVFEMGPPALPPPPVLGLVRHCHDKGYVPLVPVVLQGEDRVCWVWHAEPAWMRRTRAWALRKLGIPVFNWFVPRFWDWPRLRPVIGSALFPEDYKTQHTLQRAYDTARIECLRN